MATLGVLLPGPTSTKLNVTLGAQLNHLKKPDDNLPSYPHLDNDHHETIISIIIIFLIIITFSIIIIYLIIIISMNRPCLKDIAA